MSHYVKVSQCVTLCKHIRQSLPYSMRAQCHKMCWDGISLLQWTSKTVLNIIIIIIITITSISSIIIIIITSISIIIIITIYVAKLYPAGGSVGRVLKYVASRLSSRPPGQLRIAAAWNSLPWVCLLSFPLGFQGHCPRLLRDGAEDISAILLELLMDATREIYSG